MQASSDYLRIVSKRFKLGKIAYNLYYSPKGWIARTSERGIINTAIDNLNKKRMEKAAHDLPPLSDDFPGYDVHFLTGNRFWYQTIFCAYSMAKNSNINLRPVIHDDGTLKKHQVEKIREVFQNAKYISLAETEDLLNQHLPIRKFPYLRERRLGLPVMRKLTDVHVDSTGWKMFLDSDMLFFRTPEFLIKWIEFPQKACHMVDINRAYGYSENLLSSLSRGKIPARLNSGICGFDSSKIDWEKVEFWCKTLIEREGTHYYQEQALFALLMAEQPYTAISNEEYVVLPDKKEVMKPEAVLHHYVADSKSLYFQFGWKHVNVSHYHKN